MTTSQFLALLFGGYILVVSLGMILNRQSFVSMMEEFMDDRPLMFLTGILALAGGLSVIAFHNIWAWDWTGLVTLFGWAAAIEGALLIIAPAPLVRFAKSMIASKRLVIVLGPVYLLLSIFFLSHVTN